MTVVGNWYHYHPLELPLVPKWMPVELVVTLTVFFQLAVVFGVWWCFVYEKGRVRTAAFWLAILLMGVSELTAGLELLTEPRCRCKTFYYRLATPVHGWPASATFEFAEGRTLVRGLVVFRRVSVFVDDGSAGSLRGFSWPTSDAALVETSRGLLESAPLLDDLWPLYSLDERGFDDAPEVWDAFCRSHVVQTTPALAAIAALDTRTTASDR